MDAAERKEKIIDETMKCVAEKGLDTFSVAQTAVQAGINEALIYRDFGTRENLLHACFVEFNKMIADLYKNEPLRVFMSPEDAKQKMYENWHLYFTFLVKNGYKTLFYQQYRDSLYQDSSKKENQIDAKVQFTNAYMRFAENREIADFISIYVVDGSVLFAKRVICREIPDTEETYKKVWNLLEYGVASLSIIPSAE